jgi:hypothetical protein
MSFTRVYSRYSNTPSVSVRASSAMQMESPSQAAARSASQDHDFDIPSGGAQRVESSEGMRTTALLALYASLDASGRAGLCGILGFKTKVARMLIFKTYF